MPEPSRCWFCRRTAEEIAASVDSETPEEREIKKQMSQVAWFKTKFTESADLWRRAIPREFKDMDFQFVASNADQFASIKVLAEILDAKKLMLDWLADASSQLRAGGANPPSLAELSTLDMSERKSLLIMMEQFEARWHRTIGKEARSNGSSAGFDGLKLLDGLEFLVAEGLLYYDVRGQLFQIAMAKAVAKKPKKSVRMVQANGYPPVPLCSVCESLVMGLRVPERRQPPQVAEEEISTEQVENVVPSEQPVAEPIEAVQASAAATELPADVSPRVAEIVQKLGPASKEPPKIRGLHEHRAKEDWDELLEQQAKEK